MGHRDGAASDRRTPRLLVLVRRVLLVVVRAVSFIAAKTFSPAASPVIGVVQVLRSFCDIGPVQ